MPRSRGKENNVAVVIPERLYRVSKGPFVIDSR
jgi:hypothetical protein